MPFDAGFDDVWEVIKRVATGQQLACLRADQIAQSGLVMQMIIEKIEESEIIISDLTGRNPNVFYETAIAHMKKDPHKVILLAQNNKDVPFDLQALRYLRYRNNAEGREELGKRLHEFIKQGLKGPTGRLFETIEGKMERTRRIIADCEALLQSGQQVIKDLTIRSEAGLSCLAISDQEPEEAEGDDVRYRRLLIDERNGIIKLIEHGAVFKAILAPRVDSLDGRLAVRARPLSNNLIMRYNHLIHLLDDAADYLLPTRCQLVLLPPGYSRSSLILGERLLYEGIKVGYLGGYDLTTRVTDHVQVAARVVAFDMLFKDAEFYTLDRYSSSKSTEPQNVRRAFINGLRDCYGRFRENYGW